MTPKQRIDVKLTTMNTKMGALMRKLVAVALPKASDPIAVLAAAVFYL